MYSNLHQKILKHTEDSEHSYGDVYSSMLLEEPRSLRFPGADEIKEAVSSAPFYNYRGYYKIYILSSIDDFVQSEESFLLQKFSDKESGFSIEHIMPQTLNKQWREDLGSDHERIHGKYLHTLPNLTLTGYNLKYSNSSFQSKKSMENGFTQSPLAINRFIKDVEIWNEDVLRERSLWWKDMIAKIWPVPTKKIITQPEAPGNVISLLADHDLKGSSPKSVTILGDSIYVSSWVEVLESVLDALCDQDPEFIDKIKDDDNLRKWISADSTEFRNPLPISDTGYFIEVNSDSNTKKQLIGHLADIFHLTEDDLQAQVVLEVV